MSRLKRDPRRPRQRTAKSVVRTHLAVITGFGGQGKNISVHHAIELVKASVLYADTVEVLSLANHVVRVLDNFVAGGTENMWALLATLDDKTLRQINPQLEPDHLRQGLALTSLSPEAFRAAAQLDPQMAKLSEFANVLDEVHKQATSSMAEMRRFTDQMRVDSGVAELEQARKQKIVQFNENVGIGGDTDQVLQGFLDEIKRYLEDPTKFVLLDATIVSLVESLIKEGSIQPPERSFSNASEAVLGTGFLSRLPAFTTAPMDEVLDLRRDLDDPLGRYRRKVSNLRSELRTGPFDQNVQAEVDAVWRSEIAPAIGEIRQAMADHGLVRETVRAFGGNLADFAKGIWVPAALVIFSGNMLDLETAVTAGITAGAAVSQTVAKGSLSWAKERAYASRHDLFYLYEVNRRLES